MAVGDWNPVWRAFDTQTWIDEASKMTPEVWGAWPRAISPPSSPLNDRALLLRLFLEFPLSIPMKHGLVRAPLIAHDRLSAEQIEDMPSAGERNLAQLLLDRLSSLGCVKINHDYGGWIIPEEA